MTCLSENDVRDLLPRAVDRAQAILDAASKRKLRGTDDRQKYLRFIYDREIGRLNDLRTFANLPEIDDAIASLKIPEWRQDFKEPAETSAPWYAYCAHFRFARLTRGFPHDLAKLPPEGRFRMPGDILEVDLADVCARLTIELTLKDVLLEIEWDKNVRFSETEIQSYLFTLIRLAQSGYLRMETDGVENAHTFRNALRELGFREGDSLLLAMDAEALGYIEGGAETILDAACETVGNEGLVMVPAYAESVVFAENAVNRRASYRPYDTRPDGNLRDRTIRNNELAQAALNRDGVTRSGHPTHEYFAFGAQAAEIVGSHGFSDAPFGKTSPLSKLMQSKGSLLLIGETALEKVLSGWTMCESSNETAIARCIDANGKAGNVLLPEWPAHSELKGKAFFDAVIRNTGWKVSMLEFGMTKLYRIDL